MKVVLDTNVLVSGLMTQGGHCDRILRLAFHEVVQLCVDERIIAEYEAVLPRPRLRLDREDVLETLEVIRSTAEFVTAAPLAVALPDNTDLPFLEVASAAGAVLVTGNTRHFPARARAGVTVLPPKGFLDLLRRPS